MPEEYDSFDSKQKRKFWQTHIEQWQVSGLSQSAYCKKHDLTVNRFYDWKHRITAADKSHVSFFPVALSDSPAPPIDPFAFRRPTDIPSKSKIKADR